MKSRPRNFPTAVDAVIFDFDETLIDLEHQHTVAQQMLCRMHGSSYDAMPESFRLASGRRIIDDIRGMKEFFGWPESLDELFVVRQRYFDEACRNSPLELMRGAEPLVTSLHERGVRLAITTSAVRSSIEVILDRFSLRDHFELIVEGAEVVHGKPDPEAYLVTARRLRVRPAACVVFEDSQVGVESAKRAGTYCVAVRNPAARLTQDLSSADVILDSLEQADAEWITSSL